MIFPHPSSFIFPPSPIRNTSAAQRHSGTVMIRLYCGHFVGQSNRMTSPATHHSTTTRPRPPQRRHMRPEPATASTVVSQSSVMGNRPGCHSAGIGRNSHTNGCHHG